MEKEHCISDLRIIILECWNWIHFAADCFFLCTRFSSSVQFSCVMPFDINIPESNNSSNHTFCVRLSFASMHSLIAIYLTLLVGLSSISYNEFLSISLLLMVLLEVLFVSTHFNAQASSAFISFSNRFGISIVTSTILFSSLLSSSSVLLPIGWWNEIPLEHRYNPRFRKWCACNKPAYKWSPTSGRRHHHAKCLRIWWYRPVCSLTWIIVKVWSLAFSEDASRKIFHDVMAYFPPNG